jgi:ABC-type nickel/cobalt efflux system permease component RcnA
VRPAAVLPYRLLIAVGILLAFAAPAQGHPEGLPGIVRLTVKGSVVESEWVLAEDDVRILEAHQPAIGHYYRARFTVEVDGETCPATELVLHEGGSVVRAKHECPRPPASLTVRSTLLLDINARYRTLVVTLVGSRTERRFLSNEATSTVVPITGDVGRASDLAGDAAPPVRRLPSLERRFIGVVDGRLSVAAVLAGLAGALIVGAVHALSPGHGKSIAAAYLVGADGRPIHALLLGGVVAAMHTGSVLLLGLATWFAADTVAPGDIMNGLRSVTAVFVLLIGVYLVVTRTRAWRHQLAHEHGHHTHVHAHVPEARPFSRRGLIALGLSGGLLPSPAALVVLLAGLSAKRVPLALALVFAFSVGLAAAVAAAGLALLKGRELVHAPRLERVVPLAAAYVVLAVGIALVVTA